MNAGNKTYRFLAALLLTLIVSHLAFFHFHLEEKVLCLGEEEHFHIEKISDLHASESCRGNLKFDENFEPDKCVDHKLDIHIDEITAKNVCKIARKFKKSVLPDFFNSKINRKFSNGKKGFFNSHNSGIESLLTVSLII